MATGLRHLVGLLLALVVLGFCVAGSTADPAVAAGGSPYDRLSTQTADDDEIEALLSQMDQRYNPEGGDDSKWEELLLAGGLTATQRKLIAKYITRGGVASRWLPAISKVGVRVSVPLAIGLTLYEINRHYSGGDDSIDMWVDSIALGADSVLNPAIMPALGNFTSEDVHWVREVGTCPASLGAATCWRLQVGVMANQSGYAFGTWVAAGGYTDQWNPYSHILEGTSSTAGNSAYATTVGGVSDFTDRCLVDGDCPDFGSWPNGAENEDAVREIMYVVHATITAAASDHTGIELAVNGEDDEGNPTIGAYMTEAEMAKASTGTIQYPGGSYDNGPDVDYDIPTNAGQTAKQAQDVATSGQGPCWEAFVNWTVDPVSYPWSSTCFATGEEGVPIPEPGTGGNDEVEIPTPELHETITDYVTRLRAAGFLGTIVADSTDGWSGFDPYGIPGALHVVQPRVWDGGENDWEYGGYQWLSEPTVDWDGGVEGWSYYGTASAAPVVDIWGRIEVYVEGDGAYVPPESPPGSTGGGAPPGVPGGTLNCPDCPALDLTPLSEIEFTEAFPFGVFQLMEDQWVAMAGEGTGECLNAEFTRPEGLPDGPPIEVNFCSEAWEETYRPMLWAALYFIFTLAMIITLARHWLHMPGMVDDA